MSLEEPKETFSVEYEGKSNQFNGIMAHLRDIANGNPFAAKEIEIISPTETHPEYPLENLVEYSDLLDKCYWNFALCDPKPDENWVLFDFKEGHKVALNAYTLRSGGSSHPKSWKIEGSNDQSNWTTLHEVKNTNALNGPRKTQTYVLDEELKTAETKQGFRYIRYVQLENLSLKPERKYRINLKAIEFFGNYFTF